MSKRGEVNGWKCDACGGITYAVHIHDGVTPMFLGCRATGDVENCDGMGASSMYPPGPPPQHVLDAIGWEWYMPDARARARLDSAMADHVEQGGLMLRELTDAGRAALEGVPGDEG